MKQTIYVGYPEYTEEVTVTELDGKNISADPMFLGLSASKTSPPQSGAWYTPDVITHPTTSSAVVQLLIDSRFPTAGTFYLWWKATDSPETPTRFTGLTVVISN